MFYIKNKKIKENKLNEIKRQRGTLDLLKKLPLAQLLVIKNANAKVITKRVAKRAKGNKNNNNK